MHSLFDPSYRFPFLDLVKCYKRFLELHPLEQVAWQNIMLGKMPKISEQCMANKCISFGSTGHPKKYLWGPNFKAMHQLWDYIATTGARMRLMNDMKVINLYTATSPRKPSHVTISKNIIYAISGNTRPAMKPKLSGLHVVFDPEQIDIALGLNEDFLDNIFDLEKCSFHSTGSKLTNAFRLRLEERKINPYDQMRCWDGGASFYTCQYMNKHICHFTSLVHMENRKLISTDFWNRSQLFVDYWNGDIVDWSRGNMCPCGCFIDHIEFEQRRRMFVINGVSYDSNTWRGIVVGATKVPHCYFYPHGGSLTVYLVCNDVTPFMEQHIREAFSGCKIDLLIEACDFITSRKTAIVIDHPIEPGVS